MVTVTEPCPGVCNSTWRQTGQGQPVPGEPVWCHPDAARIRRLLAELDDLAALLQATADGYGQAPDTPGPPGGHTHTRSPSPAGDDLAELEETLLAWEDAYRDVKHWPSPPRRGRHATTFTTTTAWLGRHLDGILESPFALEFGQEVARAHRELATKTKAGEGYRRGVVPCPRCDLKLLGGRTGDGYLVCGNCNRYVSDAEYTELVANATRAAVPAGS